MAADAGKFLNVNAAIRWDFSSFMPAINSRATNPKLQRHFVLCAWMGQKILCNDFVHLITVNLSMLSCQQYVEEPV